MSVVVHADNAPTGVPLALFAVLYLLNGIVKKVIYERSLEQGLRSVRVRELFYLYYIRFLQSAKTRFHNRNFEPLQDVTASLFRYYISY